MIEAVASLDTAPVKPGIRSYLALTADGQQGLALNDGELAQYLRDHCDRPEDRSREIDHRLRDVLFCDGGVEEMKAKIDRWFVHEQVKERIKRLDVVEQTGGAAGLVAGDGAAGDRDASGRQEQARRSLCRRVTFV